MSEEMLTNEDSIAVAIAEQKYLEMKRIRAEIKQKSGDTESILGTTSDATHLLLYSFSRLIVALSTANSLAEVRGATEPFSELTNNLLSKIESGEVKLPYQHKDFNEVVMEIEQRATETANVLIPNENEEE